MKKSKLFSELQKPELIDAVTYFPSFMEDAYIKTQLDKKDLDLINEKYPVFKSLSPKEQTIEIINKYFNLDKYGDLKSLSRLDWATQLIDRKKITALLGHENTPYFSRQLQRSIFKLLQNPIASSERFLFYSNTKNINDFTAGELHSLSKAYQDYGFFDGIDNAYGQMDKERGDDLSEEELNLVSEPVDLTMISDSSSKVIASIDLSINDKQLEKEFSEFLKRKRVELHQKPTVDNFVDRYTGSLIKHNVLQYLDLKIIAAYITPDKTLTQSQYADYIFPDTPSALDKFRDSTVKHTENALTQEFIHKLLSSINKKQDPSF